MNSLFRRNDGDGTRIPRAAAPLADLHLERTTARIVQAKNAQDNTLASERVFTGYKQSAMVF
jgi:hypothetical protein